MISDITLIVASITTSEFLEFEISILSNLYSKGN